MDAVGIAFFAIIAVISTYLFIWSLVWVYRDARGRGYNPALVTLLVALLKWPVSLLLWLVIRPAGSAGGYVRE